MMPEPFLDQALLKTLLHYDPDTGDWRWHVRTDVYQRWNTRYAGKIAGYDWKVPNSKMVYRSIRIFDWPFLAHRLAVLYMTGVWPPNDTDHEDRDGLNNRWTNLRCATKAQNSANAGPTSKNKTGFRGVSFHKGRYRATLKGRWLGSHETPEGSARLYDEANRKLFGAFARPQVEVKL